MHFIANYGDAGPLTQSDSLFVILTNWLQPAPAIITGVVLIVFSRGIQKILR
jgi:hypothetical protein